MVNHGALCISLDFEKFWGIHDVSNWIDSQKKMAAVKSIVKRKLELFEANNIHASWATVGLLGLSEQDFLENEYPFNVNYEKEDYNPFPFSQKKYDEIPFELISAIEEINWIKAAPNQELASHTFSHYYILEAGQTPLSFENDCIEMKRFAELHDITLSSIVFPRNQINPEYLEICKKAGIRNFRGNQESKGWANSDFGSEGYAKRLKRLGDAYYRVEKTTAYSIDELPSVSGLLNIPANRFFRPVSDKKIWETKKIQRIKDEMTAAAKNNKVYHLWWHPHNFSQNTAKAFSQLEELFVHFKKLNNEFGFESLNMSEIGERRSK
jgi:hypothetical protein